MLVHCFSLEMLILTAVTSSRIAKTIDICSQSSFTVLNRVYYLLYEGSALIAYK